MRYRARMFADTCGRPGWPRSAATRMFGNGADEAGRVAPDEEILEKCARVQEQLAPSHWETEIVRQMKRGEPGQQWALVVRRDLCVRCLKGEPCSSEYSNESDGEEAGLRDGLKQLNV
jgi:hypothetical protein